MSRSEGYKEIPSLDFILGAVKRLNKVLVKKNDMFSDFTPIEIRINGDVTSIFFMGYFIWDDESSMDRQQHGRCIDWHNEKYTYFSTFLKEAISYHLEDLKKLKI